MSHKRPFASKVTYSISVLNAEGKPLPYFPGWQQDTHPFWLSEPGTRVKGTGKNVRVLLQSASAWTGRGGAKERLMALESMARIAEHGRPIPPLRLPDTAATVTVRANGIPPDGLIWGSWEIQQQPLRELTLSLPEDFTPSAELDAWVQELAQDRGKARFDWERLKDFCLQPWRMDLFWPHADWYRDWEYVKDADGKRLPRVVPSCIYLRWREIGPYPEDSIEGDAFSLALASAWLAQCRDAEKLPEDVIIHVQGTNLVYANAALFKTQYVGGGSRIVGAPSFLRGRR